MLLRLFLVDRKTAQHLHLMSNRRRGARLSAAHSRLARDGQPADRRDEHRPRPIALSVERRSSTSRRATPLARRELLYRSNKLIYDWQTNSLWSHLTGEPVIGPLVGKGKTLTVLPLTITTWWEWQRHEDDGEVLLSAAVWNADDQVGTLHGG